MLGKALRQLGALDEARRLFEQVGHAAQVVFGDDYNEAWARHELGCVLMDLGELEQARQQLERARALRQARGLRAFVAETELALASLALEEGRLEEALGLAEWALAAHSALHGSDREGLSYTVKARALLALGEPLGAREAVERAREIATRGEDVFVAAEVQLTGALLASRGGTPSERTEAIQQLRALVSRAVRDGMKRVELEARLLLVELDQEAGEDSVREALLSLRHEANRLGYRDLLRRAGALERIDGAP